MVEKDILEYAQSSKNIIHADSDGENEMNDAAPVLTSFEMRNIMKIRHIPMWLIILEALQAWVTIEHPKYRGRSEHDMQHVVFHHLVRRWLWAGLEVREVKCQKCTDLHSNYRRSELEMYV
ncbi:hypothetical protein TNCV_3672191 [Trichonephila clavipes]|nr:hypothetical protein TNCV_3672191 [Trichonephila clavipes]